MAKLTAQRHGDAGNRLLAFYQDAVDRLEASGQYFMGAITLGLALETAILTYLLVEFGEDNGDLRLPDSVNLSDLIATANEFDVLSAPIDVPSHIADDPNVFPKHVARDVVDTIRKFRNAIHPARALKTGFDPTTFTREEFESYKEMYKSVLHSLVYNL